MKKIIIISVLSIFGVSSAFAGSSVTLSMSTVGKVLYGAKSGTATTASPLIAKTSTGVGMGGIVDATSGSGYGVITQHKTGTKAFGTASNATGIYSKDVTAGTADTTTLATGISMFSTGWTSL